MDSDELRTYVSSLRQSAIQEGWGNPNNPDQSIMERYPNAVISRLLLQDNLNSLPEERHLDYLLQLQTSLPNTGLGANAVSHIVNLKRKESDASFLTCVAQYLDGDPHSNEARVALHARSRYYYESRQIKKAALDALAFWARFPRIVQLMNRSESFCGYLREAGLSLESEILRTASNPGELAAVLYAEFQHFENAEIPNKATTSDNLSDYYFLNAPSVDKLLDEPTKGTEPFHDLEEQILYLSRAGKLALDRINHSAALKLFSAILSNPCAYRIH